MGIHKLGMKPRITRHHFKVNIYRYYEMIPIEILKIKFKQKCSQWLKRNS